MEGGQVMSRPQSYKDQAGRMLDDYIELRNYVKVASKYECSVLTARKWIQKAAEKRGIDLDVQEPEIKVQAPVIETRGAGRQFWPVDQPMPTSWKRHTPIPCPSCDRILLQNLGQACLCVATTPEVAYFLCRGCGHRWKLPRD